MTANINSFGYVGEPAWHGIGREIDPDASVETWIEQAGFDWTVKSSPVFYRAGKSAHKADNFKVFYRSDKPDVVLGSGTDQFKPSQPKQFLQFLHHFGDETGARLETAGVLGEGEKFFVLLKTENSETEVVPGDGRTADYILGASANDGSMASVFGPSRTRVVCQNTMQIALREKLDKLRINHRSTIDWADVRAWLKAESEDFGLYKELMAALHKVPVDAEQSANFARKLIAPKWDATETPTVPRSLRKYLDTLVKAPGQREAGRTAYGLVQATTRYVDHEKQARGQESRLNSAWFGQGQALKNQALDLVVRECVEKWGERSKLQPVLTETRYADLLLAA